MNRTRATVVWLLIVGVGAVLAWQRWPSSQPSLDCLPSQVHLDAQGVAHCGPGEPLPAAQALTVGQKLDLNRVSEADLALIPGMGATYAKALVKARAERDGGFRTWEEVDAVSGIGEARLAALMKATQIQMQ